MGAAEEPCWEHSSRSPHVRSRERFSSLRFARFGGFWTPVRIACLPMQYNALVNQANGVGGRVRIASRIDAARRGECRWEPCAVPATVKRLCSPGHRDGPKPKSDYLSAKQPWEGWFDLLCPHSIWRKRHRSAMFEAADISLLKTA